MKRGDVRVSEGDKTITVAFGIWGFKRGEWIDIVLAGDGNVFSQVSVTNNPESDRYHRTLFRDLRRLLRAHDRWTFDNEGSETEQ